MSIIYVTVKWRNKVFNNVELHVSEPLILFKTQLWQLTNVPPEKQKLMYKGLLKDDVDLSNLNIKHNDRIMLIGSEESLPAKPNDTIFVEDLTAAEKELLFQKKNITIEEQGIVNLGNSCYFNAVLQFLNSFDDLMNFLKNFKTKTNKIVGYKSTSPKEQFFDAYVKFAKYFGKSTEPAEPRLLLESFRKCFPQFSGKSPVTKEYLHQDAEECLTSIFSVLNEESGCHIIDKLFSFKIVSKIRRIHDETENAAEDEKEKENTDKNKDGNDNNEKVKENRTPGAFAVAVSIGKGTARAAVAAATGTGSATATATAMTTTTETGITTTTATATATATSASTSRVTITSKANVTVTTDKKEEIKETEKIESEKKNEEETKETEKIESEKKDEEETKEEFHIKLRCYMGNQLEPTKHMHEGIHLFFKEKIKKFCEKEGKDVSYERISKIDSLAPYLIVHFVRFEWVQTTEGLQVKSGRAKICRKVNFSQVFDVFDFCSEKLQKELTIARGILSKRKGEEVMKDRNNIEKKNEMKEKEEIETIEKKEEIEEEKKMTNDNRTEEKKGEMKEMFTGHYELLSVITHTGRYATRGHYMAWKKIKDNDEENSSNTTNENDIKLKKKRKVNDSTWLQFDDDKVTTHKFSSVDLTGGRSDYHIAFLLLFKRQSIMCTQEDIDDVTNPNKKGDKN